jgi:hypothetical protein
VFIGGPGGLQMSEESQSLSEFITQQFSEPAKRLDSYAAAALDKLAAVSTLGQRRSNALPEWVYRQRYLRQRIGDVRMIVDRLFKTKSVMVDLGVARQAHEGGGGPMDLRELTLLDDMRLDFETLYIFANLALDQWAMLMAALAADLSRDVRDFRALVETLQGRSYAGLLRVLWVRHREAMIWLYYNVRWVRNDFIEHVHIDRQQGNMSGIYTPDFNLFMPAPIRIGESLPITEGDERTIRDLGRCYLPDMDVERERVTYVLYQMIGAIGTVTVQSDRECIWNLAKRIGLQTPSYHTVALRLLQFLGDSLETVIETLSRC